ncbi:hypothetical protein CVT24_004041 [Panaeolus cyanescens]|uniref:RRN7-type domain-containing protein n=1 Tax=Panaeolus cyanescens TaxID=181874 RepID=A0A409Y6B2_9AGAR|nr:hypothetical protein CVT24_004041 [Panaeolus cyanescens]
MAPRRRCPTCGSKQWHKEPASGLIACSEGHILQLIFRKQVSTLIDVWRLPAEFEVICRDLWALNLALLPDPPSAEPYDFSQENKTGKEENAQSQSGDAQKRKANVSQSGEAAGSDSDHEGEDATNVIKDEEISNAPEDVDDDDDDELDELMRENSEISSTSDDDQEEKGGVDGETATNTKSGKRRGRLMYESPACTIAVLMVACWTLRLPIMYRDLTRLIERYELPYLEGLRMLPESMAQHLTKHNVQALSPAHAPKTMTIHSLASRFGKKLYQCYGIYTPEANAADILWRLTKSMGGTPLLYVVTKRVMSVVSAPLTLHGSLAPVLQTKRSWEAKRNQYDNAPVEVSLIAAMIVGLKMIYGLDGRER